MVYPPADGRNELLCAVVPNPPRVVPEGLVEGVEARALLVNAADDVRFGSDALALPDDPQLGNR
jgi:hypothetical protein